MLKRVLVIALLGAGVALAWWYASREEPPEVKLQAVASGIVELTVSNTRAGTVKACQRSRLSMPIGGRVAALNVDEGDQVKQGDILLSLWNVDRQAMAAQTQAQLQAAQHRREQVCVEADNLAREASRLATLHKRQLASQEAAELAATRGEASGFSCQAARDDEEVAKASVMGSQALLEETYLRAPFAGVVAKINGEIGEYVTPSPPGVATPPAVDLIDYSCLYVSAPIDEVDAGQLRVGLPARIRLDALRTEIFDGRLSRIAPYVLEIERQARTVEVDVEFTDPKAIARLLVGYSADIDVILETHENTLRIPTEALLEGDRVYRYDTASGQLRLVDVEKGISNWNFTEILSGLNAGERILTALDTPGIGDEVEVVAADD